MDEALKTSIFSLYPIHLHTILVFLLQNVSTISVTYSYSGHVLFFCSKLLYSVIVQNPCLVFHIVILSSIYIQLSCHFFFLVSYNKLYTSETQPNV